MKEIYEEKNVKEVDVGKREKTNVGASGSRRASSLLQLARLLQDRKTLLALISAVLPVASAQDLTPANCSFDQGQQDPGAAFPFRSWVNRGICVHRGSYAQCQANLIAVLNDLDQIHSTEYGASAGVLALLPTIGALFGTSGSEIWTLLTILPFGGGLATMLSFGGAIMPTGLDDYQNAFAKHSIYIGNERSSSGLDEDYSDDENDQEALGDRMEEAKSEKLANLSRRISRRMGRQKVSQVPRGALALSLFLMVLLFCVVQVGMGIVEAGAVYSNGCTYYWWFHIWYIAVTLATVLDNWAYLPFKRNWKLYLTSVPYDIEVAGGEHIASESKKAASSTVLKLGPKHLSTIRAGSFRIVGSRLATQHRSSMLVLVSVVRSSQEKPVWRAAFQVFTKAASITVFVFGTCVLSAVSLLAMPMAQMVTMLIVLAGIGSRVIAGGIISTVEKNEPMIHVIVENEADASKAITEIYDLQRRQAAKFQIELNGHIFVDGQRVATRSIWWRRIFGVMAHPFNLKKVKDYGWSEERGLVQEMGPVSASQSHDQLQANDESQGTELDRLRPYTGT